MAKESLDLRTKNKLFKLVQELEGCVAKNLHDWQTDEVNYALSNWETQLRFDLSREFNERREDDLKQSPFDDLLDD